MVSKKMRIPKRFQLMARTLTVSLDDIPQKHHGAEGTIYHGYNEIHINRGMGRQQTEDTFCHELVHAVLNAMGETETCNNERFVSLFASLLHQALTTAEY